ncbi:MAG: hypothetical protein Q8L68_01860 [Methylococcales bacterium]|nr:hypothetical protein [Methylococcales bacterium]
MAVVLGTNYVLKNEPCYGLFELNYQSPGSKGFHRYQIVQVIREGDKIAEYRKDLGKAKKFKGVDQFRIPGGVKLPNGRIQIVHKVGELIDIADTLRHGKTLFDKKDLIGINKIRET